MVVKKDPNKKYINDYILLLTFDFQDTFVSEGRPACFEKTAQHSFRKCRARIRVVSTECEKGITKLCPKIGTSAKVNSKHQSVSE